MYRQYRGRSVLHAQGNALSMVTSAHRKQVLQVQHMSSVVYLDMHHIGALLLGPPVCCKCAAELVSL